MNKSEYREYLKSDHWRELRAKRIKTGGQRCYICQTDFRLNVHHVNYRNIYDVKIKDLKLLCKNCHMLLHSLERAGKIKYRGISPRSKLKTVHQKFKLLFKARERKGIGLKYIWDEPDRVNILLKKLEDLNIPFQMQ